MHEHVPDRLTRHKQSAGADQDEARNPLGMAYRELGSDPAADAMPDQIEILQSERVENLEIMEDHVIDVAAVRQLVATSASGMRGCDDPCCFAEAPVKRLKVGGDAVHISEAMKIDERVALAGLEHSNFAAA